MLSLYIVAPLYDEIYVVAVNIIQEKPIKYCGCFQGTGNSSLNKYKYKFIIAFPLTNTNIISKHLVILFDGLLVLVVQMNPAQSMSSYCITSYPLQINQIHV